VTFSFFAVTLPLLLIWVPKVFVTDDISLPDAVPDQSLYAAVMLLIMTGLAAIAHSSDQSQSLWVPATLVCIGVLMAAVLSLESGGSDPPDTGD